MPTYLDMHDIPGVTAEAVAGAHEADVKVQGKYGVNYTHYWVDETQGKVFFALWMRQTGRRRRVSIGKLTGWRRTPFSRSSRGPERPHSCRAFQAAPRRLDYLTSTSSTAPPGSGTRPPASRIASMCI